MTRTEIPVTFYPSIRHSKPLNIGSISDLFEQLKKFENHNPLLRSLKEANDSGYDLEKKKLPCFSLGSFEKRKIDSCKQYSPILAFDLDGVENKQQFSSLFKKIKNMPYVFAAFPSVSGLGFRIFVGTKSTMKTHKEYYTYLTDKLAQDLKLAGDVKIDSSTKDISRLWLYQPLENESELHINENSLVIEIEKENQEIKGYPKRDTEITSVQRINLCAALIKHRKIEGRNNTVMQFSKLASEHGVSEIAILNYCLQFEDRDSANSFSRKEIEYTVSKNIKTEIYNDRQLLSYAQKTIGKEEVFKILDISQVSQTRTQASTVKKETRLKNKFNTLVSHLMESYTLRRNKVSKEIEISKLGNEKFTEFRIEDIEVELYEAGFTGFESMLKSIAGSSKYVQEFDPLQDYLESLPDWTPQKPDYIFQLAKYVHTDDDEFFRIQLKKMLVRSLACTLGQIPFNKQIFCLVGRGQNIGKTSFLRFLCPKPLQKYFQETFPVDDKKDSERSLTSNMFILLDEVKSYNYKELNKLKQRISQSHVKMRLPYGKTEEHLNRIVNFMATTNEEDLLTDEQNVRWLCFNVTKIMHDFGGDKGYSKNIDIDNIYAQAYYLLRSGFEFKLTEDEVKKSEKRNRESFSRASIEEDLILKYFSPTNEIDTESEANFWTTTDILLELKKHTYNQTLYAKNVGVGLKKLGFEQRSKRINGNPRKGYLAFKVKEEIIFK